MKKFHLKTALNNLAIYSTQAETETRFLRKGHV